MKQSIVHTFFICLILMLNIAPLYLNSESGMLYHKYLNNTERTAERERKNMVKKMVMPFLILNSLSLGYERQISHHSGIHFNVSFIAIIFSGEDDAILTSSHMIVNAEYRYYLRTPHSSFFYNFYPFVFFLPIIIEGEGTKDNHPFGIRPGIGIGKLFKITKNLKLDFNIGVGHFTEWEDNSVSHQFVFPKIGLLFAYKF